MKTLKKVRNFFILDDDFSYANKILSTFTPKPLLDSEC